MSHFIRLEGGRSVVKLGRAIKAKEAGFAMADELAHN